MFEIKKCCFYKKHKEKRIQRTIFQNSHTFALYVHVYYPKKTKQTTKVNIQNKKQCIGHDWEDDIACEQ